MLMAFSLLLQGGGAPLVAYATVLSDQPVVCDVDIVSDIHTTIMGGVNATPTYNGNVRWTALIPGATWIWSSHLVLDPSVDETVTFTRSFDLPSVPLNGSLVIAADNSYTVALNGNPIGGDNTEYNYFDGEKDTYNVLSGLHVGANTLSFTVKNWAQVGSSPQLNPAGLLYGLHVALDGEGCTTPPPTGNQQPVITIVGDNPVEVILGNIYIDQGATAFDAEDGQINNKVVATGVVDVNTLGTYAITYNATDSQNIAADTKTRIVTVTLAQACLAPIDVMLIIDRSGSMKFDGIDPEQPLTQAKSGAATFIDGLSPLTDKAGVVTYSAATTLNSALSSDLFAVKSSFASVAAAGGTNISEAINKATEEMTANGRIGTKHVMILLSDGVPEVEGVSTAAASAAAVTQSSIAKSLGTVIYTIGLGAHVNPTLMKQIASQPSNYYFAPTGADLTAIYQSIATTECRRDPANVSGKKINDENANGVVDSAEVGIGGWEITLTEVAGNGLTLNTTTSADGSYVFSDVIPGNYLLCEVARSGWTETSPVSSMYNGCYFLNLDPGAVLAGQNFLNTESNKPQCRDGKDNDNDSETDFVGGDAGCEGPEDNDENEQPVITVIGADPAIVTLGDAYADEGAIAVDPEDGDITLSKLVTTGVLDTNVLNNYTITYNATDSLNISADTKTRIVRVVAACADGKDNDHDGKTDFAGGDLGCEGPNDNDENNAPVITVVGANPFSITQGGTFTDIGATAFDEEDGVIPAASILMTDTVDTSIVGSYTLHYNVSDSKGLAAAEKTRIVNVTPPVTECNDGIDNDGDGHVDFSGNIEVVRDAGCDSSEDNDENEQPVITVLGDNPFEIHLGVTFIDPSATAIDPEEGAITLVTTGVVDTNVLGTYTVTYDAADAKGLAADTKIRTVRVVTSCSDGRDNDGDELTDFPLDPGCSSSEDDSENAKPMITLLGDIVMNLVVGASYGEPNATVHDQEDGQIDGKLVIFGTVNTAVAGAYVIEYNATDSQDVAADTQSRTVNVTPAVCTQNCGGEPPAACSDGSDNDGDGFADFPRDPGCDSPQDNDERDTGPTLTLLGADPMSITMDTTFADPGATAHDPEDGDITSSIVVSGLVNASVIGAYTLSYNVADAQGHAATPVTRTVNVVPGGGGCTVNCGGGSVTLAIFNEHLASTGTTTVTVTWDTNIAATSRVTYGLLPVLSLGASPLYGYDLSTATDTIASTTHSVTIEGIPSGVSTYFRPISTTDTEGAIGIELTQGAVLGESTECSYLNAYMRLGANNNPVEVTKLQTFLRNYEGFTTLDVNGFFDTTTDAAVRAFQDRYAVDVLSIWNLRGNTGYVYYTTQKKVNELYCKQEFPLTSLQVSEVAAFRDLINKIHREGSTTTSVLPLVGMNTNDGASNGVSVNNGNEGVFAAIDVNEKEKPEPKLVNRGRLALSDLLATMPHVGGELSGTQTDPSVTKEEGIVAGASTKRGLAAVVGSVSDKLHLSDSSVYFLIVLVILTLLLTRLYLKRRNTIDEVDVK